MSFLIWGITLVTLGYETRYKGLFWIHLAIFWKISRYLISLVRSLIASPHSAVTILTGDRTK